MKIEVCPQCRITPVVGDLVESAWYCRHNGTLFLRSHATGSEMGWSNVTSDEAPQILKSIARFKFAMSKRNDGLAN